MRNLGLSYLLCAAGFFGFAGLHRFYLGKPVTGIIWFFTGGLAMIGTIYDLITMQSQVDEANRRLPPAPGYQALPPAAYPPPAAGYPPPAAYPPAVDPKVDLELRLLQLARQHGGRITTPLAATELQVSLEEAEAKLGELVTGGHATMDVTEEGVIVYDFPALRAT